MTTLNTFLLHSTKVGEVVVVTLCGWDIATYVIDHEDLFIKYVPEELRWKTVKTTKRENRNWAVNPVTVVEVG